MDLFLETRGSARTTGYRFLGAQPNEAWWRHGYGARTSFEHPTVLVEGDAEGVRAYLGAIPSSRKDTEGATNRVTIVVESAPITDIEDRRLIARLVGAWVTDIGTGGHDLQRVLDQSFDDATVSRLYSGTDTMADEVRKRILDSARALGSTPPPATDTAPESWIAPTRSAQARAAFLGRVNELLAGSRTGVAALVNLAGDESAFGSEAERGAAVLVDDVEEALPEELKPITRRPVIPVARPPAPAAPGRGPGKVLAVLFRGTARKAAWTMLALAIAAASIVIKTKPAPEADPRPPPSPTATPTASPAPSGSPTTAPTTAPAKTPTPNQLTLEGNAWTVTVNVRYPTVLADGRRGCAFEQRVDWDGRPLRISGGVVINDQKTVADITYGVIGDTLGALVRSPFDTVARFGRHARSFYDMYDMRTAAPVEIVGDGLARVQLENRGSYLYGKVTLPEGVGHVELRGAGLLDSVKMRLRRAGRTSR